MCQYEKKVTSVKRLRGDNLAHGTVRPLCKTAKSSVSPFLPQVEPRDSCSNLSEWVPFFPLHVYSTDPSVIRPDEFPSDGSRGWRRKSAENQRGANDLKYISIRVARRDESHRCWSFLMCTRAMRRIDSEEQRPREHRSRLLRAPNTIICQVRGANYQEGWCVTRQHVMQAARRSEQVVPSRIRR